LLASAPTRRLNPSKLAESSVLKNKLVDTISFLENLAVKDSAEKDAFFRKLPAAIPSVPLPVAQQKLLPMLAGRLLPVCGPTIEDRACCGLEMTGSPQKYASVPSGGLCWSWNPSGIL